IVVTLAGSTAKQAVAVTPKSPRGSETNGDLECAWRKPTQC
ncbi:MAG: hypothetical protein QOC85_781, partial [Streptomyces sp.]|nr:hypothetical protein [Streptomyces sp.]